MSPVQTIASFWFRTWISRTITPRPGFEVGRLSLTHQRTLSVSPTMTGPRNFQVRPRKASADSVKMAVATMIEEVELNGYQLAWLAPESEASRAQIACDRILWQAGLGASIEELEAPVFIASLREIRDRMKREWNIQLPTFHHRKTGEI